MALSATHSATPSVASAFAAGKKRAALIAFWTAGFPHPDSTVSMLSAIADGGADMIELGVPFSDPMADGKAIQRSSAAALANGMTVQKTLALAADFRRQRPQIPLVLMGYANSFLNFGVDRFAADAADAGVSGLVVVDLADTDRRRWRKTLSGAGLDLIALAAPTTSPARLKILAAETRGFLYFISLKGVTGAGHLDVDAVARQMKQVRAAASSPVAIGFGVRSPAHAAALCAHADGVVVGSRLAEIAEAAGARAADKVRDFLHNAAEAMKK